VKDSGRPRDLGCIHCLVSMRQDTRQLTDVGLEVGEISGRSRGVADVKGGVGATPVRDVAPNGVRPRASVAFPPPHSAPSRRKNAWRSREPWTTRRISTLSGSGR